MSKKYQQKHVNIELIVSLIIVMSTILGSTIPLYIHTSSQIQAIQDEIRDFHGRLCKIEEKNRCK
jgi:hypothetical protein